MSKFEEMVPATAHDRLGFLNPSGETGRVKLLVHPAMEIERTLRCTSCGMDLAVGPMFEHIDPAVYVGIVCGCCSPDVTGGPEGAFEAAGMAGNGQEAQPSG